MRANAIKKEYSLIKKSNTHTHECMRMYVYIEIQMG